MHLAAWLVAVVLAPAGLAACVTLPDSVAAELRLREPSERASYGTVASAGIDADTPERAVRAPATRPRHEIDATSLPLAHGQIVVSEAGGAMSLFFSLFAVDDTPWVHAGIVAVENGQTVVYEANGSFFPVPGLAPTATISGAVRRVGIERFVAGKRIVGLYAPAPHVDRERMVAFARAQWKRGAPFDPYFDTDDTNALYCTELVALALAAGGAPPEATAMRSANPSLAVARRWLGLRSDRVYLAGRLVATAQEVGRWSADLSGAQIDAYFAARHALHARFADDVRLGEVFLWSGGGLRMRETVQRFVDDALALVAVDGLDPAAVIAGVERLAHERFDAVDGTVASASTPRFVAPRPTSAREPPWMQSPPIEPSSSTLKP